MLKNLHTNALSYLLSLFNSVFFSNNYFARLSSYFLFWNPTLVSYHPVALSSVLGKLIQKILNKRLFWYLELKNLLSPAQYGFRKDRNNSQALFDLQNEINVPSPVNSYLYSVFFDHQEAFPHIWRHCIVQKLFELGLRGNLSSLLQSFLNNRSLMIRIQNVTSSPLTVENGVPQGEVFSVPFFFIAIMISSNV